MAVIAANEFCFYKELKLSQLRSRAFGSWTTAFSGHLRMSNPKRSEGRSFQMAVFASQLHVDVREAISNLLKKSVLVRKKTQRQERTVFPEPLRGHFPKLAGSRGCYCFAVSLNSELRLSSLGGCAFKSPV